MVHAGVVESRHEMRCARPRRRDTNAELACEFCMRGRHEGGHFLVTNLNEFDRPRLVRVLVMLFRFTLRAIQRAEHAVDAVAGIAKNSAHAPRLESLDDEVTDSCGHGQLLTIKIVTHARLQTTFRVLSLRKNELLPCEAAR